MHGFLAHMLQLDHEDQDANDDEDVVEALPDVVGLNDLEEGDGADPQFIWKIINVYIFSVLEVKSYSVKYISQSFLTLHQTLYQSQILYSSVD